MVGDRKTIHKIALGMCKDKKILMARYKGAQVFYFIGGQKWDTETDRECLIRKVPDEIGAQVRVDSLQFLEEFEDVADGRDDTIVRIRLYTGEVEGEPLPTNDVSELRYLDTRDDDTLLSPIAIHKMFPWLKAHHFIT